MKSAFVSEQPLSWIARLGIARRLIRMGLVFGLGAALALPYAYGAETFYVAMDGDDTRTGIGDWTNAVATISNGVALAKAAGAGSLALVAAGDYPIATQIIVGAGVTLRGYAGSSATRIIGPYPGVNSRCVHVNGAGALVEDFTVTGGGLPTTADSEGTGGGVRIDNGILRDCVVVSNVGVLGGGVYVKSAGLVTNCTIISNTAFGAGVSQMAGGISCNGGQVWNSWITGNLSTNPGGSLTLGQGGGAAVSGNGLLAYCIISNNTAYGPGGGAWMYGGILSNCTIIANRTLGHNNNYGAGVSGVHYTDAVYPRLYGCDIYANSAYNMGGGIMVGDHPCVMQDCNVISNTAGTTGAGIAISGSTAGRNISINRCVASHNQCAGSGVGIYTLHSNRELNIDDTIISHNTSTNGGNGAGVCIASAGGSTTLRYCLIEGNVITNGASASGCGVSVASATPVLEMRNCAVIGNVAWASGATYGRGGGLTLPAGSTSVFNSCTVAGNFANYRGGGIYLYGAGADRFTNCVVAGNSISNAGEEYEDLYPGDAARKNGFFYSCSPLLDNAAQGNITNAPAFAAAAAGNYRLTAASPCVNSGTNAPWMLDPGAEDLDGRPRLDRFTHKADMGCYEFISQGTLLRVR